MPCIACTTSTLSRAPPPYAEAPQTAVPSTVPCTWLRAMLTPPWGEGPVPARRLPVGVGVGGWVGLAGREDADERPCGRVICSESGLHARSAATRLHPPPTVGAPKWPSTAMAAREAALGWRHGPGRRLRPWDLAQADLAESLREQRGQASRRIVG